MQMNASSIVNQKAEWEKLGVKLPAFDHAAMTAATKEHPIWVHFGAGNIFRGFIARLQQPLLEQGLVKGGIIAADTFDFDIMDQIYAPHDSMTLMVSLKPDGSMEREVVASIASAAVQEVPDVTGLMGANVSDFMGGKKMTAKGVRVEMDGEAFVVYVFIMVRYGCTIGEVAKKAQNAVYQALESTTGYPVSAVNVHVGGISFN